MPTEEHMVHYSLIRSRADQRSNPSIIDNLSGVAGMWGAVEYSLLSRLSERNYHEYAMQLCAIGRLCYGPALSLLQNI